MKKKLSFLLVLLFVSAIGWAEPYCEKVVTTTVDYTSLDVTVTVKKQNATTVRVILDNEHITGIRAGGTFQQWGNGVWANQDDAVANFAQGWTQTGNAWHKDFVFSTYPTTGNFQIYILMDHNAGNPPVAGFTLTNIDVDNECSGGGGGEPAVIGICASETYETNEDGYAIHAQVTKGCNKYYLTISSATEGKTITGLNGDNMFCHHYSDEGRTHNRNYHMAASGHYTVADGKVVFTIPSVGDPDMYTPIYVRFNDGKTCNTTGLQGVRLEPCSSEDPADCPDPAPSEIEDTNFALISNGVVAYASSGNAWEAIDNNDETRWASNASDPQWYVVDLGQRRIFNTIQFRWETAYPKTFTIDVSNDGETWTTKKTESNYTEGGDNVEYEVNLSENVTARYVRLYSTARATQWGNSFYSFRVLLKGIPVLTSVGLSSNTTIAKVGEYATLTPSPKDQNNGAIAASLSYTVSPADAGHVTDNKYYPDKYGLATITVTATAGGVEVSNNVQVWGVVSDNLAYSSNISTDNKVVDQSEVTGDATSAFYAVDGNKGSVWQACRDLDDNKSNVNFTSYFTLDLGSVYSINLIAIWFDGAASDQYTIDFSTNNSDWQNGFSITQSIGNYTHQKYLSMADLTNNDQARYVRFTTNKASTKAGWGVKIFEMEVYGAEVSSTKTVSATVTPASSGSVVITAGGSPVTEVESGTSVTFTATANDGYDFVNWTQGGVEVSTNLAYTTTITANTALVANFEAHRTAYCSTPVTDFTGKTLYLTITNPSSNTYKIQLDGSADNKISSAYNNFNFVLSHINGESGNTSLPAASWTTDDTDFGSAYVTFTATNFRDIAFVSKYVVFNKQGGGLTEFNAFPDASLIKWDATCTDDEAPVLAAPVATPLSGTSVRLALSATDNMAALLTYTINYKPAGSDGAGTDVEVAGTAGETTYQNIKGLAAGTRYQFSVTVSDGINESDTQVCYATPSMATAPVPTHNADLVRSVYSDKYESALAHDFIKNNWAWPTYAEQSINGDHLLVYTSDPETQAQMPDVAWGDSNDGANAIIAKDGLNDGTNKGLDVRSMAYMHVDIWSAIATNYPELRLNDTEAGHIRLDGSGWQSFDLPLASLTDEQKTNIRWIKFIAFRTPNPEEIAIDNVYFWQYGAQSNVDKWSTFAAPVAVKVPNDVTVYTAEYQNDNGDETLTLHDAGKVIPANTGVLLACESASTTYAFTLATSDEATAAALNFTDNSLVGCATRTDISSVAADHDIFCLRRSDLFETSGFFIYSGQYIPAGKAYLPIPKEGAAPSPSRRVRFVFDTTTSVENTADAVRATKFIEDGQLFIRRGDVVYTIQGTPVK